MTLSRENKFLKHHFKCVVSFLNPSLDLPTLESLFPVSCHLPDVLHITYKYFYDHIFLRTYRTLKNK